MDYSDEPLVSSDFIHDAHSLVIDSLQTMSVGRQFKVFAGMIMNGATPIGCSIFAKP